MSTYTQIMYHLVFSTKNRERVFFDAEKRKELFFYIWGVLKNHHCHLYRLGGVEDHIHILTHLHPDVGLSHLIKGIKVSSSDWMKREKNFPAFSYWQEGYGAFTHCFQEKMRLVEYIKGQEKHHEKLSFQEELKKLLEEAGIDYDEKYLD